MSRYDLKFEVCYLLPHVSNSYDFAQCMCDIITHGILVSFYWQRVIQVSYAVLQLLLLYKESGPRLTCGLHRTIRLLLSFVKNTNVIFPPFVDKKINHITKVMSYQVFIIKNRNP